MLEEAIPTFLASFHTWFTPTVLFVLLNVVIGTIAVTSKASRREHDPIPHAAANESVGAKLSRSSSAILHSFNLHNKHLDPTPPLSPASETDPNEPDPAPMDLSAGEIDHNLSHSHSAEEIGTKLVKQKKKSARENPSFRHFEEAEILADSMVEEEGKEVDARADAFINRFRQQLKLQRLDSVVKYKTMLSRGQ